MANANSTARNHNISQHADTDDLEEVRRLLKLLTKDQKQQILAFARALKKCRTLDEAKQLSAQFKAKQGQEALAA